jgi:hypothetical protein
VSLQTRLSALISSIGTDIKALNTALNGKAPLANPVLTGTPTAPTASANTKTTQIATTEFVNTKVLSGSHNQGAFTINGPNTVSFTMSLPGAVIGDAVFVSYNGPYLAGIVMWGLVGTPNVVTIVVAKITSDFASVDASTYKVGIIK